MRRLIVNADDLGLTQGVNRAILEAHLGGVVSSATLMANGDAFDDAVATAQKSTALSVGCHVVLVQGEPVRDGGEVRSLLSRRTHNFPKQLSTFGRRAVMGRLDREQLVDEIVAQVQKIRGAGVQVTHLDTHKHTHIFPVVLEAVVGAALICGVPAIRNPFVPRELMRLSQFRRHPGLWKRYGQVKTLGIFGRRFRQKMSRAGLATPDGAIGVVETGRLDLPLLQRALENLPDGTWELVCHPGYNDDQLRRTHTRLLESREQEQRLLMSRELHDFLEQQKIRLIGYRELAGAHA